MSKGRRWTIIGKTGFDRNAAIVACKEVANENDETRKRFEVMCREVFKKFKACINVEGVNSHRADRDAINIVYKSLFPGLVVANLWDWSVSRHDTEPYTDSHLVHAKKRCTYTLLSEDANSANAIRGKVSVG